MSEISTYRKIIKSGSLFGGVQVATILIAIVRSKCLALLIGPSGYGIFALLNSTVDMIRQATGFGLEISSVKNISEANSRDEGVAKKASVVLRLAIITGFLGMLLAVVFSHYLSLLTFKNDTKTIAIILISISILLQQVTGSQSAVMQGMGRLGYLAKTNLYGNITGLALTLPLYFFFKVNAIVPAIILSSVINSIISSVYYKKLGLRYEHGTLRETYTHGKEILYFGGLLAMTSFLPVLSNYVIQIYISQAAGIATVGLFTIGMAIINSYVGVIFTALSAEYYPRLAAINKDAMQETTAVNQQAVIAMLAIVPIIIFFLGFSPLIIKILFSEKFNDVVPLLSWAIVAMFFKSVSFSMGYVIIARGDSKVFMKTALIFNTLYIAFCMGGFYLNGLEGLGIGFFIYYGVHLLSMAGITMLRYSITYRAEFYRIFFAGLGFCAVGVICNQLFEDIFKQATLGVLLLLSVVYSYIEIDKRIQIRAIFTAFINRKKNES